MLPPVLSSDSGEILTRRTHARVPDRGPGVRLGPGPEAGPGPVHLTVQKLRDLPPPRNEPRPNPGGPARGAADSLSGTGSDRGEKVLTWSFRAGGRGAGLGALSQCCHSAPHKREVGVQLLKPHLQPQTTATPQRSAAQSIIAHSLPGGLDIQPGEELQSDWSGKTAAAAIKDQSHLEERVSQLTASMKLLHTRREAERENRGLQTLQQQQLLLQTQMLDSALNMLTGHSWTSDGRSTAENNQQKCSSATEDPAFVPQTVPITMETQRPQQTRDPHCFQDAMTKTPQLQSLANSTQETVRRTNHTLLETERKTQPEDSWESTVPTLVSLHVQQNQPESHQEPVPSHHKVHYQSHLPSFQSQSPLVQKRPVQRPTLEEAAQVLRQAQRRKKVLEDNLEALQTSRTGELLHCRLEALAANRDQTQEVQVKQTVDAWMFSTRDVQTCGPHSPPAEAPVRCRSAAGRGRQPRMLRPTGSRRHRVQEEVEPSGNTARLLDNRQEEAESFLNRLYGKLPHEGLRRTLKKSPYPRFSSPASPLSKKTRPRLVESVRGVRMKSCKTQTSLSAEPLTQCLDSSHLPSQHPAYQTVAQGCLPVAMAIPLGRPRMDNNSKCERSRVTSLHPDQHSASVIGPELQQQPQEEEASAPPSRTVDILEAENQEHPEEVLKNTVLVADVSQEEVRDDEEEVVVLDGGPAPALVLYHGPAFPPEAHSSNHAQKVTPILGVSQQEALETRLVEWVEQQLMSRMISDMYRPPVSDFAYCLEEPEERSLTSDVVKLAEGDGLQLFVDSNTPVDSEFIRRLVNEVLTETVVQMLSQREALDAQQGPAADEEKNLDTVVPTPVPTPLPGVIQSSREATPVATPSSSEPSSPQMKESPQSITAPGVNTADPETVSTSRPKPLLSKGSTSEAPPPLPWGDPLCHLDETRPEEQLEPDKEQLIMSVVEEEPPVCSPVPPPPPPPPSPPPPSEPALTEARLPSTSSEDLSSSSSTVTAETEASLKHISEGELLISVNQLTPLMEEEGVVYNNSSSLHELLDMDFDHTTLEQVRDHDLLLTQMQQRSRLQVEGPLGREEEVSEGEVKPLSATDSVQLDSTSSSGEICPSADEHQEEEEHQGGTSRTGVHLPIIPQEEGGGGADTDVF